MKKYIISMLISIIIVGSWWLISNHHEKHKKQNVHYNGAVVISIGQCNEGRCSYTYKTDSGFIENGTSIEPVSIGQKVYQECWFEEARGDRCYVNYEPK